MNKHYFRKSLVLKCLFFVFVSLGLVVGSVAHIHAQEVHFTQFDYNPLFVNPANTGNFKGDFRVAANYRNISEQYRTASFSIENQFYVLNQNIGAGLFVLNDESGILGMNHNKIYGSVGYGKVISNNYIGLGIQAGFVFGGVNDYKIFDYSTGGFTLPSGEPTSLKASYLDINLGLVYKRSISIFEPEVGISFGHLNRPNPSFYDSGDEKLDLLSLGYTTIKTNISDKIYITPKILVLAKPADLSTVYGAELGYNVIGNRSTVKRIFAGMYISSGDLTTMNFISVQAGATVSRFDLAINYDVLSTLPSSNSKIGTIEIAFIFRSISTVLNSYSIPCERF
ncbi:MAG: PorP/SprF family type IX secretion system membrane protein [Bacteroidales bacterium]|nr:PorP/SprF family type IX secretion system membrane protein [Bacteroidales bacterium]MBN2817764.1 PorP/SprF family type IX secretion system membrane protein [Bacteroidales bacterium]